MSRDFPATRWSLIARLPGAPQAAADLLGLYADAIGAYLEQKLAGERRETVEDVVQEVLLDLLAKPDLLARATPGAGSRFRWWLMTLAWGAARNALRRQRRQPPADAGDAEAIPAPDQQAAMERAWALSVVRQALDEVDAWSRTGRLEAECAPVLRAHLVEGRPLREVAEALGLPLATCHRRLARARRELQGAIADRLRLAGDLADGADALEAGAALLDRLGGGG